MKDAHGNQWNQHQLTDRKRETGCHEKYRPTDRINNSATDLTNTPSTNLPTLVERAITVTRSEQ